MKKNYFYRTLEEELGLLRDAVSAADLPAAEALFCRCGKKHEAFCLRLFREFVTPLDRGDLYALSQGILCLFPRFLGACRWNPSDRAEALETVDFFLPLPLGERALQVRSVCAERVKRGKTAGREDLFRSDFLALAELFLMASLRNA